MPSRRRTEHTGCTGTPRRRKELPPLLTQDPPRPHDSPREHAPPELRARQPGRKPGRMEDERQLPPLLLIRGLCSGWSGGFRRRCFASCGGNSRVSVHCHAQTGERAFRHDLRQDLLHQGICTTCGARTPVEQRSRNTRGQMDDAQAPFLIIRSSFRFVSRRLCKLVCASCGGS